MNKQKTDFLTIEDAVKLTRTSESTVRRFLRSLSEADRVKVVRKEGKRLYIAKQALQEAFDLLPGIEDQQSADLVTYQRQQLQEAAKLTSKLTDQNDRLLNELTKTSEDLKTAWSLIDNLKAEVFRLTGELKRLEAPGSKAEKTDRLQLAFIVVLCLLVVLLVVAFVV